MTKTLSGFEFLECSLSGEKYPIDKPMRLSPSSEKPLLARYDFEKISKLIDEPIGDSSLLPSFRIFNEIKRHTNVSLSLIHI